jgi:hypothetical protein
MEMTSARSMIVRITPTLDVQVRKMDAIKTSNRRKCASRVASRVFSYRYVALCMKRCIIQIRFLFSF